MRTKRTVLDPIVKKYLRQQTRIMIDATYQTIIDEVYRQIHYRPSKSVLYACVRRIGVEVVNKRMKWAEREEDYMKNKFHPCNCKSYNGNQCYNCLNGAHDICDGTPKCRKPREKQVGLVLSVHPTERAAKEEEGHHDERC